MKKIVALLLSLCLLVLAAGCGANDSKKDTPKEKTKVSLGMLRLTSSAPLFIAMDKGFFAEEGIEIEPQWFDAAHPIAVSTASSKVDVGATGITASLYNMAANGQKLGIVADKGREQKGYSSSALLVTTDNYNAGVKSLKDLKGKRIGITQKGSTFHYMLGRMLETQGMSLNDVEIVPLSKLSAVMAALESKQIDGCILNEPNITKVQKAGYGKLVVQVGDVIPYQTSAIFYSPDFMKNKDAAVRFMRAYNKACNYYYEAAVEKKDAKKLEEVVNIVAKYVKAPAEDIKAGLPYIDKDGKLLVSDIATQIKWYTDNKMISGTLDAKDVANTSFLDEAMKK
ncbi:ABC transporter substrate-binding protein [Phascolarctobacterium succinatutens]|uniref:ABC transporter substrate-binding protein n=2 Tax=Phascolarctobacterium succinatutens TaxID=626940 RepID=UPI0025D3E5EB|nr:ABC transporter substrate-binding protein [Phascolarctobacterium succinatutens]